MSAGFSLIVTKIVHKVQFLLFVLSSSGKPVAGGLFPASCWVFFLCYFCYKLVWLFADGFSPLSTSVLHTRSQLTSGGLALPGLSWPLNL